MEHNVIDKSNATIKRTGFYYVSVCYKKTGEAIEKLEPKRLFPISQAQKYIALLDENEKEVAYVRDANHLDIKSKTDLLSCLDDNYRIPRIKQIVRFVDRGRLIWYCETDKGPVHFHIHRVRQDIRFIGNRVLIRDYLDNRYEIPDYTKLDKRSLRILNTFT